MNLDLNKLNRAIAASFQATAEAFGEVCQDEIEAVQWSWDGVTLRKNGEFATSPRSIVDTGDLFNSYQEPVYPSPDEAILEWTADHALEVHNGAPGKAARPWTERAVDDTDFEGIMGRELRKRL